MAFVMTRSLPMLLDKGFVFPQFIQNDVLRFVFVSQDLHPKTAFVLEGIVGILLELYVKCRTILSRHIVFDNNRQLCHLLPPCHRQIACSMSNSIG